jgi:hypothetical protein
LQLVRQVAIGSRRVAIGLSSCNWFSCEVATAESVHLLYRMHLGCILVSPYTVYILCGLDPLLDAISYGSHNFFRVLQFSSDL